MLVTQEKKKPSVDEIHDFINDANKEDFPAVEAFLTKFGVECIDVVRKKDGWTALLSAAWSIKGDMVEYLLRKGASADILDSDGRTIAELAKLRSRMNVWEVITIRQAKIQQEKDMLTATAAKADARIGQLKKIRLASPFKR